VGGIFKSSSRPTYRELAEHWSPFIYQATSGRYDYITRFDFDGNWIGHDNWENYECYPLPAYVYYSVIESTNYYFITYLFFHPRDEGNPMCDCSHHENDSEGCRVTIRKDGSYWGSFYFLETIAHHDIHSYPQVELVNGSHPAVYVKQKKHSVYGQNEARQIQDCYWNPLNPTCRVFPSDTDGTGIGYWNAGRGAEIPESVNDRDVSYELLSLDEIWQEDLEIPTEIVSGLQLEMITLKMQQRQGLVLNSLVIIIRDVVQHLHGLMDSMALKYFQTGMTGESGL